MTRLDDLDDAVLHEWHVLGSLEDLRAQRGATVRLCERILEIDLRDTPRIRHDGRALPARLRYGYLWSSLGEPAGDVFDIPEYDENDRRNIDCGRFRVAVSAPRAIENFLDMGHFPFVHTGILGVEPRTEVKPYEVRIVHRDTEILATRCRFFQPKASPVAGDGVDVEYVYRVPHPYCSILYKSCALDPARMDVIMLAACPSSQESCVAHMLMSVIDDSTTFVGIRSFQQMIFGQDKPILENQQPKRLPLSTSAEPPVRADASSVAYRRWLGKRGVSYGVIRAGARPPGA